MASLLAHSPRLHRLQAILIAGWATALICIGTTGCGSGGSVGGGSVGGGGTPQPDFALLVSPGSLTVQAGTSTTVSLSASGTNGFTGSIAVTAATQGTGISVSPTPLTLQTTAAQRLTIDVAATAPTGTATVSLTGVAAGITHTATVSVVVNALPTSATLPMHYLRTQSSQPYDSFFPQPHLFYHAASTRFFYADLTQNRLFVVDALTLKKLGEILLPGAFQVDETADGMLLWIGTQTGNPCTVDPFKMVVTACYPSRKIGPNGFFAYEVHPMADGRLFLLGGQGGNPSVDGFSVFGIWDPVSNVLKTPSMCVDGIALAALTADRKKALMTSYTTSSGFCIYDPATDSSVTTVVNPYYDFSYQLLVPPDNKYVLVNDGNEFNIFSLPGLQLLNRLVAPGFGILSRDGKTLYVSSNATVTAYDWASLKPLGTRPAFPFPGFLPAAMNEGTIMAGQVNNGIALNDMASLATTGNLTGVSLSVSPPTGVSAGGTSATVAPYNASSWTAAYWGSNPTAVAGAGTGNISVTTPAGVGIVDVTLIDQLGNIAYKPEAFSYGPNIDQLATTYATAEGGGTLRLFGAGLSAKSGSSTLPSDLSLSIANTTITPTLFDGTSESLQQVVGTIPPLASGIVAPVNVTTSLGSSASTTKLTVLPEAVSVPLAGAKLMQGVYDSKRDLYYFTDAAAIQVFSRTGKRWVSTIPVPGPEAGRRLMGIALSPDKNLLAFADYGTNTIFVMQVGEPTTIKAFPTAPAHDTVGTHPIGVAILNNGTVYYCTSQVDGTGSGGLRKLNTATGVFTINSSIRDGDIGGRGRVLLSADGARIYTSAAQAIAAVDTVSDATTFMSFIPADYELAISANATSMTAGEYITDTDFNIASYVAANEFQSQTQPVYGEKLSPDGSLLFSPTMEGVDLFDAGAGTWLGSVATSVSIASVYDALVSDGSTNVLVAVKEDGVAILDFSKVALPLSRSVSFLSRGGTASHALSIPPTRHSHPLNAKSQSYCDRSCRLLRLTPLR